MTAIAPFSTTRLPRIVFGEGAIDALSTEARAFGTRALVVTGRRSLRDLPVWRSLNEALEIETVVVADEPSPDLVDAAVAKFHGSGIDVVIGLGGGSALDAAKAIAGLMVTGNSVMDHIEASGVALPTTGRRYPSSPRPAPPEPAPKRPRTRFSVPADPPVSRSRFATINWSRKSPLSTPNYCKPARRR